VSVSAAIGSLSPNTTYHYRLVTTNGSGTTFGDDKSFTTVVARAPGATTAGVKSVAATSATLTGSVDPAGQATSYRFEYGPTTTYGSQTPPGSAGTGTSNVSVSAAVGSLAPSTTYHYRLLATNASGTTFGADKTFKTSSASPGAPSVTTGAAKAVAATSATLTGTVNPRGAATSDYFQFGRTTAYGGRTGIANAGSGTKNVSVSVPVGSLAPNTVYHYRLVATNASGTTVGSDRSFRTAKASRVTILISPNVVVFGRPATIAGTVLPPGPIHTTVALQRSLGPAGPFVTVATATSSSKGAYAFTVVPSANSYYRALANGVASAPARLVVRFRITLAATIRSRHARFVRFHGVVAPAHNGFRVLLQRLGADHRWHTVARPRLHRARGNTSTYSLIRLRRSGLYRAVVGPDARHARGFSRAVRIRAR
jgi:hypothetical protein